MSNEPFRRNEFGCRHSRDVVLDRRWRWRRYDHFDDLTYVDASTCHHIASSRSPGSTL